MTIPPDILGALPARAYEQVRGEIRDGDLLLCSATDFGSRMIRWATKSQWSHIAIAFRMEEIDRVLALECVERIGVRAVPISDFITRTSSGQTPYPGKILLARHTALATEADRTPLLKMNAFAFDRLGDRFSNRETAKIALRIACGRLNLRMPRILGADDEYICSEYVARCFAAIGLPIPWDGLGFVAPGDFAQDPRIEAVAQIETR
jgi:hypothetical protein